MVERMIKGEKVDALEDMVDMPEVLEADDHKVVFQPKNHIWKYGTVGQGVDVMRLVWPNETHVFSCQTKDVLAYPAARSSTSS
jgi:hypothetical protein